MEAHNLIVLSCQCSSVYQLVKFVNWGGLWKCCHYSNQMCHQAVMLCIDLVFIYLLNIFFKTTFDVNLLICFYKLARSQICVLTFTGLKAGIITASYGNL